jgi:hypothetical protein
LFSNEYRALRDSAGPKFKTHDKNRRQKRFLTNTKEKIMNTALIRLCLVAALLAFAPIAPAQIIFSDDFDDGNPLTNATGVGTYTAQFLMPDPATEAGGILNIPGVASTTANNRGMFYTDQSFQANGATPVTVTLTLTEVARTVSDGNATTRFFLGITPSPVKATFLASNLQGVGNNFDAARIDTEYLEGLWVVIHGRKFDYWNGFMAGQALLVNQGGLFFNAPGGTITRLAMWDWSPTLFTFDDIANAGGREDRVAFSMVAPNLTIQLTSDATGYNLAFSSTDAGVAVPAPVSGTWAAAGVDPSILGTSSAIWHTAGRYLQSSLDKLVVEAGGGAEGEGEGELQTDILSNVYPPFIDEGTVVILTAPLGSDYQWHKDGQDIVGANNRELVFDPVTLLDAGTYTVTYNDGLKAIVTTPPFNLSVQPEGSVPVAGVVGLAVLLSVGAMGGAFALRKRSR